MFKGVSAGGNHLIAMINTGQLCKHHYKRNNKIKNTIFVRSQKSNIIMIKLAKIKNVSKIAIFLLCVSVLFNSCDRSNLSVCAMDQKEAIVKQYEELFKELRETQGNEFLILRLQDERNKKLQQIGC